MKTIANDLSNSYNPNFYDTGYPVINYLSYREEKLLDSQKIKYIQAMGNYVKVYLESGERLIIYKTLKEIESLLPDASFLRVHRSFIVNKSKVTVMKNEFLFLENMDKTIPVGKTHKKRMLEIFSS